VVGCVFRRYVVGVHPLGGFTGIERVFVHDSRQGPRAPSETSRLCTGEAEQDRERGDRGRQREAESRREILSEPESCPALITLY